MTARWVDHFASGIHSARPAASAVPKGAMYACSTHGLIYQSDGTSTWSTWATLGGSGGLTAVTEVTTPASPAAGTQTLFIDSADHHLKRVNSSGTVTDLESGAGSAPWTSVLNNDLSSLTGFTGLSGTWAVSSGVTRQSDTTASTIRRLKCDTKKTLPPVGIVQVDMKYNARSSGNTRMGLLHKFDGTSGGSGYVTYLQTTDGTSWTLNTEVDAVANLTNFGSVTYTSGNWVTLRIPYNLNYWNVYLDGALLDGAVYNSGGVPTAGFVGLYTYGCDASFRNFKVWTPTLPA